MREGVGGGTGASVYGLIQCSLGPQVLWHKSVLAKWHLIPSNGFSRVHECDRRHTHIQADRQTTLLYHVPQ